MKDAKFNSNFPIQFWTEDDYFVDFRYGYCYYAPDGRGLNIRFISEYHFGVNMYENELAHVLYVKDIE